MITVLLATYNGERYLREQLDSVLGQTLPGAAGKPDSQLQPRGGPASTTARHPSAEAPQGLRVLASDDLSTDGTPEILREYAGHYPERLVVLKNATPSGGAWQHFFRLLAAASGDYFMFCDQDDAWAADKVAVTLETMGRMEAAYGADTPLLVHGDVSVTDSDGNVIHKSLAAYQKIAVGDNSFSHFLVENNITGSTVMINGAMAGLLIGTYDRADTASAASGGSSESAVCHGGGSRAAYGMCGDVGNIPRNCVMHDWWMGLMASCFGHIGYVDRPLVRYRQHGDNALGARSGFWQTVDRMREWHAGRYGPIFAQAEEFHRIFADRMPAEHMETLEAFIALRGQDRWGKMSAIRKHRLYKSTPLRTLGMMLSV
ncbi:MAG: glycosyltransferase family 2 protein [Lachnospiraceae bacterium]|jgi:hypothetical protein|nr:glycosyltransferase family 2 protein [Lachnospiraceae bacterium]